MFEIKNIAIIGLGLIGSSIAKAIRTKNPDIEIAGFDREKVLETAIDEKIINLKLNSIEESKNFSLIFLCLPVEASLDTMENLAPVLTEKNLLTDVCSVKQVLAEKWTKLNSKANYIGGHPMTGKEKGGIENSDPLLFENSIYILSKNGDYDQNYGNFYELIVEIGAKIVFLQPEIHDEIVASVSHLPQLLSVALMNSVAQTKGNIKYTDFGAGGFRDMTRIASSDFNMWEPIIGFNKKKILEAFDTLHENIHHMLDFVEKEDMPKLNEAFESARFKRDEIPSNTKGFLHPLHDLYVYVKDEPGIIMKISTALFEKDINIKDIELLKIREGEGGVFRLSFDEEGDVARAEKILHQVGFATK